MGVKFSIKKKTPIKTANILPFCLYRSSLKMPQFKRNSKPAKPVKRFKLKKPYRMGFFKRSFLKLLVFYAATLVVYNVAYPDETSRD